MSVPNPVTILLVDNDEKDRSYYGQRLKVCSPEYVILEANTGISALQLCQSHRISCIVTELDLPDMSAFELLLRAVPSGSVPRVAVIILAQFVLPNIAQLARANGAQACLMKRFTSGDDLEQYILRALSAIETKLAH